MWQLFLLLASMQLAVMQSMARMPPGAMLLVFPWKQIWCVTAATVTSQAAGEL